ncbi:MAG TPA: hypothetical protein ENN38_07070 [Actinobacteria bacterium]|nr:hypothetical protein [Actinomycetota bacterium]
MRELLGSALKIILIVVIAFVIMNDVGIVITSYWHSSRTAADIANAAAINYKLTGSAEQAQATAKDWADQKGVEITDLKVEEGTLTASIKIPSKRTYIIRHIKFLENILPTKKTVSIDIPTS